MVETKAKSNAMSYKLVTFLSFALAISVIMLVLLGYSTERSYDLPLIMVFGVVVFVIVLTITSVALHHTNPELSCKNEALGLPSGSVRALIALSLIIIFAIMAVFMYNQLGFSPQPIDANVTIVFQNGTIFANPNGTVLLAEPTQAQKDFSLQTLTTVSTLVVAIASFYFGAKAVETSRGRTDSGKNTPGKTPPEEENE